MRPQTSQLSSSRFSTLRLVASMFTLLVCFFWAAVVRGFTAYPIGSTCVTNHVNGVGSVFILDDGNGIGVGRRFRRDLLSMHEDENLEAGQDAIGCIHHTALKTRNITLAIQFYGLLGFETTAKFKAGPARAAWLEQEQIYSTKNSTTTSPRSRIELIEVPSWILKEPEGMKRRALDLFEHQEYLGQNHLALDVTASVRDSNLSSHSSSRNQTLFLSTWMETLNEKSLRLFRKTLRVGLQAEQFMVGNIVYERAFIYDADGALIELLHKAAELPQRIDPMSGWERYEWFEDAKNNNMVDSSND